MRDTGSPNGAEDGGKSAGGRSCSSDGANREAESGTEVSGNADLIAPTSCVKKPWGHQKIDDGESSCAGDEWIWIKDPETNSLPNASKEVPQEKSKRSKKRARMKANQNQKGAKTNENEYLGAEKYVLSAKNSENQDLGTKRHISDTKTPEN